MTITDSVNSGDAKIVNVRDNLVHQEHFLHWIWGELRFDTRHLYSRDGHAIEIIDPGKLNKSDGPDFTAARLYINHLFWYGNIELHLNEKDWYTHQHHRDPDYNGVILHVILNEDAQSSIRRNDGTIPHTLNLKPHLPPNLHHFLRRYKQDSPQKRLPCSTSAGGILRDDIFLRQLSRAHRKYFYQKVYELFRFWDHRIPWQQAWKRMLTTSIFDGLGITHNRESMIRLARYLFRSGLFKSPEHELIPKVINKAGLSNNKESTKAVTTSPLYLNWNFKGVRPNNRPTNRIKQGIRLLKHIQQVPMSIVLEETPEKIWNHWIAPSSVSGLGKQRSNILYGISLLPSLKVAADLKGNRLRGRRIRHAWNMHRVPLPRRFASILDSTHLNRDIYSRCLGTVYQLKQYCFKHRCQECLVFQKAFNP